ncbi:hypothetical protein AB432_018560 [Brevibacillus brevis]|uniref:Endonuclease GajA/Old nuclease/RecF-like AAA domain-containing protein n=1 Tax=Brevibacillus brevis TaxID=1393 RepID=A0A2Z4MK56_BREBE|nr:AAA family ATPase [Brevibacillus brevis]AWX56927.1 hypothetical protein AB432_018560 [Brevibacillus brevis]
MLKKIRIKNLRSLIDTGEIDLKPLTLLVGKNSSGKSTFLRFFPLMKQTLETRTYDPILWYSSRYVDFGSYKESVNKKNSESIDFEFSFSVPRDYFYELTPIFVMRYRGGYSRRRATDKGKGPYHIKVCITCKEKYIEQIKVEFENHTFQIFLKSKEKLGKLIINDIEFENNQFGLNYLADSSSMLPRLVSKQSEKGIPIDEHFSNELVLLLKKYAHSKTSLETIYSIIEEIQFGKSEEILESLLKGVDSQRRLKETFKDITKDSSIFKNIENLVIGKHINPILIFLNFYLQNCFSRVNYIGPIRARAERYYRIQGLSVDEIDPQGENIPMILHNMTDKEKSEFSEWTSKHFGFEITTQLEGGHTSLRIKYNSSPEEMNLADTGFGHSQILPIILLFWKVLKFNKPNRYVSSYTRPTIHILVIEQPELHLHPALQARLIDTLINILVYSIGKIDIKVLIETHSETIINRIGQLLSQKIDGFKNDIVNVMIFNKQDSFDSTVEVTGYNEQGYLLSWPIGFFSPEDF